MNVICISSKRGAVTDVKIQFEKEENQTHKPLQMWRFIIKKQISSTPSSPLLTPTTPAIPAPPMVVARQRVDVTLLGCDDDVDYGGTEERQGEVWAPVFITGINRVNSTISLDQVVCYTRVHS